MTKFKPTPLGRIRSAIRQVWLRSRERSQALKDANYCCEVCGVKQTAAKGKEVRLNVHHIDGIDWDGITELVHRRVLQHPDRLKVMCKQCHQEEHK